MLGKICHIFLSKLAPFLAWLMGTGATLKQSRNARKWMWRESKGLLGSLLCEDTWWWGSESEIHRAVWWVSKWKYSDIKCWTGWALYRILCHASLRLLLIVLPWSVTRGFDKVPLKLVVISRLDQMAVNLKTVFTEWFLNEWMQQLWIAQDYKGNVKCIVCSGINMSSER